MKCLNVCALVNYIYTIGLEMVKIYSELSNNMYKLMVVGLEMINLYNEI